MQKANTGQNKTIHFLTLSLAESDYGQAVNGNCDIYNENKPSSEDEYCVETEEEKDGC